MSKKLLKQVQEQQNEVENENPIEKKVLTSGLNLETPYESEEEEPEYDVIAAETEAVEIDPNDESALELFMGNGKKTLDLGALIMQKIKEKEMLAQATSTESVLQSALEPKIIGVYSQIAGILRHHRSGRLPKAIKILPALSNWEELLYLTQPEQWSPAAVRQVTKIFASNLGEKEAQKFFYAVLLPQIRQDIRAHKKLNWHIYLALKKALFKPAAFYKGIVIPLCEAGDCSLREAIIVSSVIRKTTIPVLPSSVTLMKIAELPYSGANSLFIRVLIDKKYALPFRVIDALVQHFLRFRDEKRPLPVLWHQSLLSFSQRYKQEITLEQKQQLKLLLREKTHYLITPEIRRELFNSKSRGDETTLPAGEMDVDQ
uniref:Bystin n=1 Tax=Arcella intermedia TaxID=1963864 RepID=A0A6B2L608_9EUKA